MSCRWKYGESKPCDRFCSDPTTAVSEAFVQVSTHASSLGTQASRLAAPYVEYIQCDITTDDLSSYFNDVDGICHAAGVVCLMNNPNLLHNVHVVGTQRVLNAARASGVGAFVFTSSTYSLCDQVG